MSIPRSILAEAISKKAAACIKCKFRDGTTEGIETIHPRRAILETITANHISVKVRCPACNGRTSPPTTNGKVEADPLKCKKYILYEKRALEKKVRKK